MNILAIETTGCAASIALVCPGGIIAEQVINNKLTHSQVLMSMIENMFASSKFNKGKIDLIACSAGPGSFTGLRIGAAAAKGLAFGLNVGIVPVSTLDALAYNASYGDVTIVPIMDARRNQVYTAIYDCINGQIGRRTEYLACDMDFVIEQALKIGKKAVFLGDGVAVHGEKIAAYKEFSVAHLPHMLQRASSVGTMALEMTHKALQPRDFAPFYVRPSQAEREAGLQ